MKKQVAFLPGAMFDFRVEVWAEEMPEDALITLADVLQRYDCFLLRGKPEGTATALMAGLRVTSAWVSVGPPLSARTSSFGTRSRAASRGFSSRASFGASGFRAFSASAITHIESFN